MAEAHDDEALQIESLGPRTVVALRVALPEAVAAAERLALAPPGRVTDGDPCACWLGPDRWWLMSDEQPAASVLAAVEAALAGLLHHAVDGSAGFVGVRVTGGRARDLLASGTALDLRASRFGPGACARTRFAQVPVVLLARSIGALADAGGSAFELWVERPFGRWLSDWLAEAAAVDRLTRGR